MIIFPFDRLVEEFFVEWMKVIIIFAFCDLKPFIPQSWNWISLSIFVTSSPVAFMCPWPVFHLILYLMGLRYLISWRCIIYLYCRLTHYFSLLGNMLHLIQCIFLLDLIIIPMRRNFVISIFFSSSVLWA